MALVFDFLGIDDLDAIPKRMRGRWIDVTYVPSSGPGRINGRKAIVTREGPIVTLSSNNSSKASNTIKADIESVHLGDSRKREAIEGSLKPRSER